MTLNKYKSMGPDAIHTRGLRELAEGVAKPPPIISEKSWQSGHVVTGKKETSLTFLERVGRRT